MVVAHAETGGSRRLGAGAMVPPSAAAGPSAAYFFGFAVRAESERWGADEPVEEGQEGEREPGGE